MLVAQYWRRQHLKIAICLRNFFSACAQRCSRTNLSLKICHMSESEVCFYTFSAAQEAAAGATGAGAGGAVLAHADGDHPQPHAAGHALRHGARHGPPLRRHLLPHRQRHRRRAEPPRCAHICPVCSPLRILNFLPRVCLSCSTIDRQPVACALQICSA